MNTSHNGNDYERLKEELRRLKRRGAPWYFESALHQRLHGARRRRPRLRPISVVPVIALAFFTLCILALAVYAVMMHTNLVIPGVHTPRPAAVDTLSPLRQADTLGAGRPGPSAPEKRTPHADAHAILPARPPADTSQRPPPGADTVTRPVAAPPEDTLRGGGDSSSHGIDTTVPAGGRGR